MLRIKGNQGAEKESWIGPTPCVETVPPGTIARAVLGRGHGVLSPSYGRDYPLVVRRGRLQAGPIPHRSQGGVGLDVFDEVVVTVGP